jgi:hypothetical protein
MYKLTKGAHPITHHRPRWVHPPAPPTERHLHTQCRLLKPAKAYSVQEAHYALISVYRGFQIRIDFNIMDPIIASCQAPEFYSD